ncbi:MAG: hypothetical protein WEC36_02625 [Phycisphaeraceae bacterium]
MPVFDFSVIPQRAQALATDINALNRARIEQSRQDEAYNALRQTYGPTAGDPERTSAMQQIGINRQDADLRIAQGQRTQQAFDTQAADAAAEQERTAFLEAATYIQAQIAQRGESDPSKVAGEAFDAVAGQLNMTPEQAAQIRQTIVANPAELDDFIASLGGTTAAVTPPNAAMINAQQPAILNALRFASAAAARGDDPVAALNAVIGNLNLPPAEAQRLAGIAGNPAALDAYITSFGNQDEMLARIEAINALPPAEREAALQVLLVVTPQAAQEIAAGKAIGTGQGEALLGLPAMAGNIAQVASRVEDVLDPARAAEFAAVFGLPGFAGFREGGLGYLGAVPGSPAANAAVDLEQILGDISAAAYASLRGGGQITEAERTAVERSYANLNRQQSFASFQQNLREFQTSLDRIYERQQTMARGNFDDFLLADPTQDDWARGLFRVDGGGGGTQAPTRVTDQAGVDALPAGTRFIWTDGREYTKD